MNIVIDSNIIISKFHLSGPKFRLFEWYLAITDVSLFTPQVVVDEVANKYREKAKEIYSAYSKSLANYNWLLNENHSLPLHVREIETRCKNYDRILKAWQTR